MKPREHWDGRAGQEEPFGEHDWRRFLAYLGEDPLRQGLLETPRRVQQAWAHWTSGYADNPADILKVFEDGAQHYDEMIVVRGIPVYSHCEHHLAPFFGSATIAYQPDGRIVGLSKLTRLVQGFARRLQVQERLTTQIGQALATHLAPRAVGVQLECRHMCMESRGIQASGEQTVTSALFGALRTDPLLRAEFFAMARQPRG